MKTVLILTIFIFLSLLVGAQNNTNQDIGWPRTVSDQQATIVYYQPQIDKWDNYKKLSGRMAFSFTPKNGKGILGVTSFTCDTKTDKDTRTTFLYNIDYTDVRFQSLDTESAKSMKKKFLDLMPEESESLSVDRIMADLDSKRIKNAGIKVKNDPPPIFYSASPAILLIVYGNPIFSPINNTDLEFVVNTNWDLFYNKSDKQYFLLANNVWLTAEGLKGPWMQARSLPGDMFSLPSGQNFDDVKKFIPPPAVTDVPAVFFSSVPAELILTKGAPVYAGIPGTDLLYITNSDNDIFIEQAKSEYYILLSGRWFWSKSFGGPWGYVGNNLPSDFAKIPKDSPKANVLASVPGTVEASDAVILAQIPTTVVVNRSEVEAGVKVVYDGNPKFEPIQGTSMEYAVNTQNKVIKVGDLYYLCFQAVWFVSTSPDGPWKTVDSVPSVIYTIPPGSPVYNVIYVTQTNPTATTVECSTTSGYFGVFVMGVALGAIMESVIVYGTGWYYPPYIYYPPGVFYPIYRPLPCTYGAGVVYNPWMGGFVGGRTAYGPYGAAGTSAWYNPATGRYGRSASVQGWYGGRTAANTYNPWTGTYGHTSQGYNAYSQWGHSAVSNGYQWARSSHVTTANGTSFVYQTSGGSQGVVTQGRNGTIVHTDNNIYAGHDGHVYRKSQDGTWMRTNSPKPNHYSGSNVQNLPEYSNVTNYLNRYAESRQRGQMQIQHFQRFQKEGKKFNVFRNNHR